MIIGQVNARLRAIVPVMIYNANGQLFSLDGMIDTGFSGHLTLPLVTITTLQLSLVGTRFFSLGNRTRANFNTYSARVRWDGENRDIVVVESEARPLIGMLLLKGFRLTMDAIDGGEVRIERRP